MATPDGLDQARAALVATRDHLRGEAERCAADAERIERALACLDEVWAGAWDGVTVRTAVPAGPGSSPECPAQAEEAVVPPPDSDSSAAPPARAGAVDAGTAINEAAAETVAGGLAAAAGAAAPGSGSRIEPESSGVTPAADNAADDEERVLLSERERAVMTQLWRARDEKNQAALSQRVLAERAGIPAGSMTPLMAALVELKCIRQVRPADTTNPTMWRLLCDPDGRPARVRTFTVEPA